jgi:mono/diheme cytochrome c family protein
MRRLIRVLVVLALVGGAAFWVLTDPRIVSPSPAIAGLKPADLANGERLFYAGGCASCHKSEGQDDALKLGGGHRLGSPFGAFVAPNISPHPRDGIGGWSLEDFVRAMAAGVAPDGSHYYPSFPYTSYRLMPAQDLADLFGYLKTLAPVEGRAAAHEIGFPFNVRRLVGGWKLLFFGNAPFASAPAFPADAGKGEEWLRGRYLVEGPGHCAECHSSRNGLGAITPALRFAGGPDPEGKGWVPNITQGKSGIGAWSKSEIAELLKSGFTPSYDSVGGTMTAVIRNTSKLTDADRQAMAAYLKSLPAVENARPKR